MRQDPSPEERVANAAVTLVRSQWTELGVPAQRTLPARFVVDPLALVLWSPSIVGTRDRRLAMLIQAWCAQHGHKVFGSKELVDGRRSLPEPARQSFDAWASVLRAQAGAPWPPCEAPVPAQGPEPAQRQTAFRSDRPLAVHLRARCLFGIGPRADVACALAQAHAQGRRLRRRNLDHTPHSERAIQQVLASLELAGLVEKTVDGRTHMHVLTRPDAFLELLGAHDAKWKAWHHALPIASHLVHWVEHPSGSASVRNVQAHAVARTLAPHVHAVHGLVSIPVRPGQDDAHPRLLAWAESALHALAGAGPAPR